MTARRESVRAHLEPHELAQWDALWRRLLAPLPDERTDPEPQPEDDRDQLDDAA
jgi:hypothetical protein